MEQVVLTPDTLARLTPDQRLKLLEELGTEHYGTARFRTAIARDFDIARSVVGSWNQTPRLIPNGVLLTLSAWVHHARFRTWAAEQISAASDQLAQLSASL
jgi:hypothetical protein